MIGKARSMLASYNAAMTELQSLIDETFEEAVTALANLDAATSLLQLVLLHRVTPLRRRCARRLPHGALHDRTLAAVSELIAKQHPPGR